MKLSDVLAKPFQYIGSNISVKCFRVFLDFSCLLCFFPNIANDYIQQRFTDCLLICLCSFLFWAHLTNAADALQLVYGAVVANNLMTAGLSIVVY